MTDKKYWIWLSLLKVPIGKKHELLVCHTTPKELLETGLYDSNLDIAERVLESCYKMRINIVALDDLQYPDRLRQIIHPPIVLYYRGNLPAFDELPTVGIVGSRKYTMYGGAMAERFGYEVAEGGGYVVSGLARGLDALAHKGALKFGSCTSAVLGCGCDKIYPKENERLYWSIVESGAVISEYPPGTPPYPSNFPNRNRIVSGLSLGVLVVEASYKSGALITANLAADQGRDVFAVPGNIDVPGSEGTNELIKSGAKLVTSGWDVLAEYVCMFPDKIKERIKGEPFAYTSSVGSNEKKLFTELQQNIIVWLAREAQPLDGIIEKFGLSASAALAELMVLEIEGAVVRLPGNVYSSVRGTTR